MKRSKLRNTFLKSRKLGKLLKKEDISKVTDNQTFWKTVLPLFSNKLSKSEKINLTEGNKAISNNDKLC